MKGNRRLLIIFLALVTIYAVSRLFNAPQNRNFDKVIIDVDTAQVSSIHIHPKDSDQTINLAKKDGQWFLVEAESYYPAASNSVASMLNEMRKIEVKRLVARGEAKYDDYEVGEETGTRVEVFGSRKKLADFMVGKFTFNQQTRNAISYIRQYDSPDTYALDGFMALSFNQSSDSFRDKELVKLTASNIQTIDFMNGNENYRLRSSGDNYWSANGVEVDSSAMASYLNALASANGADISDLSFATDEADATITLVGEGGQPTVLTAKVMGSEGYLIHSSVNEPSYFSSDSSGIYKRIFLDLLALMESE
jgi:hypothetical protein